MASYQEALAVKNKITEEYKHLPIEACMAKIEEEGNDWIVCPIFSRYLYRDESIPSEINGVRIVCIVNNKEKP